MAKVAERTGYYFNRELPRLALIAKGIRLPPGRWVRIAEGEEPPWRVQEVAAGIGGGPNGSVPFIALLTDFDVLEFERELDAHDHPDGRH